ncbi:glycosyltransferase family 4 protein [Geminocystis sp. GBBB08]|uniref:glycosyltransferase family 4 protein n=1 Tax=Geminocystis sp. GBBB08 TaxID=2604140 RepID=UPI0027E29132|nr:glycosyltransferase family 4 protein [Geminocystis sp. GBBB08]MBL1210354.1 glycosyltransferase [Geminocystis sp. GBBB08]
MKITHLSTFDIAGGAARATYRLHEGLLKIGEESQILSLYKTSSDNHVLEYKPHQSENNLDSIYCNYIQNHYINNNRTSISNTLFSLGYSGVNVNKLPSIINSDILNLHWITSGFLSPLTIKNLLDLGKPVVWTLHDMWPFTGGCHYTAGCQGYENNCLNCLQLSEDIFQLPHHLLQEKIEFFNHPNLVIVTPSQWLAECAKKSQVFRHNRIEVIPYSLNTHVFKPLNKKEAKKILNLNSDDIILLVGAVIGKEKRKGFIELINSLKICQNNHQFSELINNNRLKICCFGELNEAFKGLGGIEVISLGNIKSDEKLSLIYSAADVFILPSLEDNFPNTMLESMSCSTPVIAFNIGGIPDLIEDEISGMIVPYNNIQLMSAKIIQLINDRPLCESMGKKSREIIINNYELSIQANNYQKLYQELMNSLSINQKQSAVFSSSTTMDNKGKYFEKIYTNLALYSMEKELQTTEKKLNKTEEKLLEAKKVISEYQETITAMESSKFWSLRKKWFEIKNYFR